MSRNAAHPNPSNQHPHSCEGPSRREVLQWGTLGLAGLSLADYMRMDALASNASRPILTPPDTSVIFIWLPGGPPHMETFDMKPEAPSDYRGEFRPISTTVPGMEVCELLPKLAACGHQYNIVRSISHNFADHGGGHKRFMTGRIPKTPVNTVNDAPAVGSIVAKMRDHYQVGLPNYVSGTNNGRQGVDTFAMGSAYLGPAYTPFIIPGHPNESKFEVPNLKLSERVANSIDDRQELLKHLDNVQRSIDGSGAMSAMDQFGQQALDLLTSDKARAAFDLSEEPQEVRDRYGMHPWGQRALMARRLVEAGSSFVTMVMENPMMQGESFPEGVLYNWDSHAVNGHIFNDAKYRMPFFDRAISALIEDVHERGLNKNVMVIVTGEFGRTPRLSTQKGTSSGVMQPGRDHWPSAMSLLISGGGMRTGQIIGSTNSKGENPKDRPLTPNDLWATVYRHLGIDTELTFPDYSGRPMPILPFGNPIEELLPVS
ncbi:MAG: DUF1501 domain-containing protein [Planctomycetaceae bacterium]|jgi:hypothetical protein|nr:DUF1501 domain-containing protein [Planctomycetaceae bacterium]